MRDTRRAFLRYIDENWPTMAAAFRKAIGHATRNLDYRALRNALQARDVDAAMRALNLTTGLFGEAVTAITVAYTAAGQRSVGAVVRATRRQPVGRRVIAGFDPGNPRAAEQVRARGAELVQRITDTERMKIVALLDEALTIGAGPNEIATEIAGRVVKGRRMGGHIGLTGPDARDMARMREALRHPDGPGARLRDGSRKFWIGDDGKLKSSYKRRNKRYDGMIRRAIEAGKPIGEDEAARALDGFRNKILKDRAENIARTEMSAAQTLGQDRAYGQMIEDGQIAAVDFEWDATGDGRTRETHAAAEGQTVPHGQPFTVGGYQMMGPGDSSLGAPASETNRCRCWKRPKVRLP